MLFIVRRLLLACAIAAVAAPVAAAPPEPAGLTIEPTTFKLRDGAEIPAEIGTFHVPEDRANGRSRQIAIRFLRFRSTNPNPGAPIVYLAGGPGGSGIDTAKGPRQPVFLALRQVADVIALDQRGTGRSNAIPPCAAEAAFDPALVLNEANFTADVRATLDRCRRVWRDAGVAIEGYTTVQSADDLEDLRKALGARRLNLWGISYGTHLALAAMRRHPGSFERVALASVEGMDQTVKRPDRLDAAMGRIAAAGGDPALVETMRRVHARFDAQPQTVTVSGPQGSLSFRMDSFPLRMIASGLAKNPSGIARLKGLYDLLDAGGVDQIAPMLYAEFLAEPLALPGMPIAMDVASGVSPARLRQVNEQAPGSLLGRATNMPMPQLVGAWPELDLGDAFRREIRSDIPTLVLSGDLDLRTPLEEQAEATAGLTRKRLVLVRNGGHDLWEAHPDIPALLVDFFSGRPIRTTELVLPAPKP